MFKYVFWFLLFFNGGFLTGGGGGGNCPPCRPASYGHERVSRYKAYLCRALGRYGLSERSGSCPFHRAPDPGLDPFLLVVLRFRRGHLHLLGEWGRPLDHPYWLQPINNSVHSAAPNLLARRDLGRALDSTVDSSPSPPSLAGLDIRGEAGAKPPILAKVDAAAWGNKTHKPFGFTLLSR